jgi:hypothetical protein
VISRTIGTTDPVPTRVSHTSRMYRLYLTGTIFEMNGHSLSKFLVSFINESSNCPRSKLRELEIFSISRDAIEISCVYECDK